MNIAHYAPKGVTEKMSCELTGRRSYALAVRLACSTALMLLLFVATACSDESPPTPVVTLPAIATSAAPTAPATSEPQSQAEASVPMAESEPITGNISSTEEKPEETPEISSTLSISEPIAGPVVGATPQQPECTLPISPDLSGREDLTLPLGCPALEASYDPVAINEFGEGPVYDRFMLWFGSEQQIYVLFADGTWLAYTDAWKEGEAEITCNPSGGPATSPPLPRRGFGKLWCTVESVRTRMGEIDREERLCQHAVVQRFVEGRLLACYEDATIRYFSIKNDGTWEMEMVQ